MLFGTSKRTVLGSAILAALLMFVLATIFIELTRQSGRIASVWLANGAVLAVMLRSRPRHWPAIMVAAFAGNLGANFVAGDAVPLALVLSTCNLVEIAIVAIAMRQCWPIREFGELKVLIPFASASLLAPLISGLAASAYLAPSADQIPIIFRTWFFSDALGLLIVTPIAFALTQRWALPRNWGALVEPAAFMAFTAALTFLIFSSPAPHMFLPMPVLLIAGLRLPAIPAVLVAVTSSVVAIWLTVAGKGPVVAAPGPPDAKIFLIQAYVATALFLTLPVSALTRQRDMLGAALQKQGRQFRLLAEASPAAILHCDGAGLPTYLNPRWTELTGYTLDDIHVHGWDKVIEQGGRDRSREMWEHALASGGEAKDCLPCRFEKRPDGWADVYITPEVDDAGGIEGWVVRLLDASDRIEWSQALERSAQLLGDRNRLLNMAEKMAAVGHWLFDIRADRLDLSESAARILGLSFPAQMSSQLALAMVVKTDRRKVLRMISAALNATGGLERQVRIKRASDEEERIVRLAIQCERNGEGEAVGLFATIHDISEKVEDDKRLLSALEDAKAAADAKSAFLATMSHEIRTPLTGVLGMIDLLDGETAPDRRAAFLATLKQSATLLMAVLNDILDYSKMEHDALELDRRPFALGELIHSTVNLFDSAASRKGLTLSAKVDSSVGWVEGDAVRLQQVVSNLVNNAIKFTESGRIEVVVSPAESSSASAAAWRFEVRDTGIGIDPGQLEGLFDPFVQADRSDRRKFGGTGLGLAISRRLVSAMGGKIGVDTIPGVGSTFWFEIRLDEAEATATQESQPAPGIGPARPLDILLAEDNAVNQVLITNLLKRFGHEVTCVANGLEAVELANERAFDCILMDMQMPEMDGVGATRSIRMSGGPNAATAIVALTADAAPERRRFYDNVGLSDFMTKPIDSALLERKLRALAQDAANLPAPAIDASHMEEIRGALGDARFTGLLELLFKELGERPGRICTHVDEGMWADARAEAHSLKGAALSVGAGRLASAASHIEEMPENGSDELGAVLTGELRAAASATIAALRPYVEGQTAERRASA